MGTVVGCLFQEQGEGRHSTRGLLLFWETPSDKESIFPNHRPEFLLPSLPLLPQFPKVLNMGSL